MSRRCAILVFVRIKKFTVYLGKRATWKSSLAEEGGHHLCNKPCFIRPFATPAWCKCIEVEEAQSLAWIRLKATKLESESYGIESYDWRQNA
jgi:hypothetical protein